MDTSLASVIDLYLFPTGRRLFAMSQLLVRAQAAKHTELVNHCKGALEHDRACLLLERRWIGMVSATKGKRPVADKGILAERGRLDNLVDRTVAAIRDHAVNQTVGADADDPIHAKVRLFLAELFPGGVQEITGLPYVEELAAVEGLLGQLKIEWIAEMVVELGLERLVTRLEGLTKQYRAALEAPADDVMSFAEVRAARTEGQERLVEAVAMVVGKYHSRSPEHSAARGELLRPILDQQVAIGAALRARKNVADVNPETGTEEEEAPVESPEAVADA